MRKGLSMRAFIPLIFLFTGGINMVYSQGSDATITGVVINPDGEPLPGVHLSVADQLVVTVTNSSGEFRLGGLSAGDHTIRVSMIGFDTLLESIELEAGEIESVEFVLTPIVIQSDEVVVTASRRSQLIGRVAVSMNTISPEEIRFRNVNSLDQILDYVPGVQVLGSTVNIRGSSGFTYGVGSRVLLLVDGVPMMGPDQGNMDLDGLPLTQVRQIEIQKSPGSALYGGGALGGVVNVITRRFPETAETTLRYYTGLYQPVRYEEWKSEQEGTDEYRPRRGLLISRSHQASDRFGYWISGSLKEDAGYLEDNRLKAAELYTKLGWAITDDIDFTLFSSASRKYFEGFLYWNGLDDVLSPGTIIVDGVTVTGGSDGLSDRITLLPVFRHTVSEAVQYTLKGRLFGVAARPIDSDGDITPSDMHNTGIRYGGEAQVDVTPTERLFLTGGFTYDQNHVTSELYFGTDRLKVRHQPEGSVFMQAEMTWNEKLVTTAGFRYDAYQVHTLETTTRFSPKFSASYAFSNFITSRISFGQGFRVPSVAERFIKSRDFFPLEPNLTLKPETSTGYEAGLTMTAPLGSNFYVKADLSGFWNEYQDLVEPTFVSELSAFQFVNLTEARVRGFEASLTFSTDDFMHTLDAGYTYLDARDLELEQPLLYRSRHLLQVSGRSAITDRIELGFDFRAASAPERVDTDFSLFVPDAEVFPDIFVTDARMRFSWEEAVRGLGLSGTFIVRNLFDYYYVERPAIFAAPRSFEVVLDVTF